MLRIVQRCALAGLLTALGCNRDSQQPTTAPAAEAPVTVAVMTAAVVVRPATEEAPAVVRARLRAGIEAKISARIEEMLVAPGDAVKAGEVLARLETREIQARLDQALPTLKNTEAETARFKALLEKNAVSRSEYEAWEARFRVAQAAVAEAETMLSHATISAPFDGVITRKFAEVGDLAHPGRVILEMEDPRTMRVEADVPESLIGGIKMGASLWISGAQGENRILATVTEIAPAADAATRTFLVKLNLPAGGRLRSGQFARVEAPAGESRMLLVPSDAILTRGQLEIAYVADAGTARLRLVKTGKRFGNDVDVVAGITPGEKVIVRGVSALRDGQPIHLSP